MLTLVKSRKQISKILDKKIEKEGIDKSLLAKRCDMSRSTIYQLIQSGNYKNSYSFDNLLKVFNDLGIKIYIES